MAPLKCTKQCIIFRSDGDPLHTPHEDNKDQVTIHTNYRIATQSRNHIIYIIYLIGYLFWLIRRWFCTIYPLRVVLGMIVFVILEFFFMFGGLRAVTSTVLATTSLCLNLCGGFVGCYES